MRVQIFANGDKEIETQRIRKRFICYILDTSFLSVMCILYIFTAFRANCGLLLNDSLRVKIIGSIFSYDSTEIFGLEIRNFPTTFLFLRFCTRWFPFLFFSFSNIHCFANKLRTRMRIKEL